MAELTLVARFNFFVPCPRCGHNNRVARNQKETLRAILLNRLPECKRCHKQLEGADYDITGLPYSRMVKRELGLE